MSENSARSPMSDGDEVNADAEMIRLSVVISHPGAKGVRYEEMVVDRSRSCRELIEIAIRTCGLPQWDTAGNAILYHVEVRGVDNSRRRLESVESLDSIVHAQRASLLIVGEPQQIFALKENWRDAFGAELWLEDIYPRWGDFRNEDGPRRASMQLMIKELNGILRVEGDGYYLNGQELMKTARQCLTDATASPETLIQFATEISELLNKFIDGQERNQIRTRPSRGRGQWRERIGIVTSSANEYAAVEAVLDNCRDDYGTGRNAGHQYLLGEIPSSDRKVHRVVVAMADMGNNAAATRATRLLQQYPTIRHVVMTGIAGGVPWPEKPDEHVRLGDIVISDSMGVVQFDFVKQNANEIIYRPSPRPPSPVLLQGAKRLMAGEISGKRPWLDWSCKVGSTLRIDRPGENQDVLFASRSPYRHTKHPERPMGCNGHPRVFLGSIASANTLLKDPVKRDELRDRFHVKAVEMEGSGIADASWDHEAGYIVVRGISDYCDRYKNDIWQPYAAVVAAAYTRVLLEAIPCLD